MKERFAGLLQLKKGDIIPCEVFTDVNDVGINLSASNNLIHLQFRRFSGCPICNLHLQAFVNGYRDISRLAVSEIVVFHSPKQELKKYVNDFPFTLVADPHKILYKQFGVEESPKSIIDPRAWKAILKGVMVSLWDVVTKGKPMPPGRPGGGSFGLPADFLIEPGGKIIACKYGKHADDQWSLSELFSLVESFNKSGIDNS